MGNEAHRLGGFVGKQDSGGGLIIVVTTVTVEIERQGREFDVGSIVTVI